MSVVDDRRWKRLLAGMWKFSGYISIKVSRRGNTTTAATGNLLPIAAVTVYIKVCALLCLFLGFLSVVVFALYA